MKLKLKKMNLSKNEKYLLVLLGVVVVFWIFNRFIFTSQRNNLQSLKDKKIEYEEKAVENSGILARGKGINEDFISLNREKDTLLLEYFPKLDQSQIIFLLNEMLDDSNLEISNLNFSEPQIEEIRGIPINTMDISIPYKGKYGDLLKLMNKIEKSPRKLLITNLIIDQDEENLIGELRLKAYSSETIFEKDEDFVAIDTVLNTEKENPFKPFVEYEEVKDGDTVGMNEEKESSEFESSGSFSPSGESQEKLNKTLVESFDEGKICFVPSHLNTKGNVYRSRKAKEGKYSLRFEYNILAVEEENRAYLDFREKNINFKYPPDTIGFWVYSYGYSPATLGIRFEGQMGEKIDVEVLKGINWIGWRYIEVKPPEDLNIYPLKLDKMYLELANGREDFGVILLDGMECVYPQAEQESNADKGSYTFYIVKEGDTIESISMKYYGRTSKKKIIMNANDLSGNKGLRPGRILVIPK